MKRPLVLVATVLLLLGTGLSLSGCGKQRVEGVATVSALAQTPEAIAAGISDESLAAIKKTAERFAERFGTFTNQDDFANYQNLQNYATPEMQTWMQKFIADRKQDYKDKNINFYGVTTTAVVSEVLTARPDHIKILVDTKREEITDTTAEPKVTYQNIVIELQRTKNEWKVSFAQFE